MKSLKEDLQQLKGSLNSVHIMVLGDVMIDRYIVGTAHRISPEAPVPVVRWRETLDKPGGASNVAANLKAMGCKTSLLGLTGEDEEAKVLEALLMATACDRMELIRDSSRPTSVKTRIMSDTYQIARIDKESESKISQDIQQSFLRKMEQIFREDRPQVIILQDYNKGLLHQGWISQVIKLAKSYGVQIAVDPKKHHFFEYQLVDLFKPNLREALHFYPEEYKQNVDLLDLSNYLKSKLHCSRLMITLAAEGIWISGEEQNRIFPTAKRKVIDVSGAGDTVISLAAICMAQALSEEFMALCCNEAGGQVCEQAGVVPVDKNMLLKQLEDIICNMNG